MSPELGCLFADPWVVHGRPTSLPAERQIRQFANRWVALDDVLDVHRHPVGAVVGITLTIDELPALRITVVVRDEKDRPALVHHLARRDHQPAECLKHGASIEAVRLGQCAGMTLDAA